MEDKKKSVDFWAGSNVEFDSAKAIKALQAKVTQNRAKDPAYYEDAPRLIMSLQTKPRSADAKAEMSIFQAFKGITPDTLKGAMIKLDAAKNIVTFAGFDEGAPGLMALDKFLQESGALRRSTVSRSKGWAFVSDPALASTPKLAPHERVGSIEGARQISIALPPAIARALPSWAGAALMVGFFVECQRLGLTQTHLEAFLASKRAANNAANNNVNNNATNNANNPDNNDPNNADNNADNGQNNADDNDPNNNADDNDPNNNADNNGDGT